MSRCDWAKNELAIRYHDEEWGVPLRADTLGNGIDLEHRWFEFLTLEGAQAGLSWDTILKKRDRYREVFDGFDPVKVAGYGEAKRQALLSDPGIVRNRLKVASAVRNAKAFLAVQEAFGGFDAYMWAFVEGEPIQNRFQALADLPAKTPLSDTISKDLKRRGFNFVGSTIVYALMQATGMVNDHLVTCPRNAACAALASRPNS
ncbi:MAG: DNA-3-methyladenine glycosylase I [Planctomycetota bacterium]